MAGKADASVSVSVEGVEGVEQAARRTMQAWERAGDGIKRGIGAAGGSIVSALGRVAEDALRVTTALNTISLAEATREAQQYAEVTARLGISAGRSAEEVRGKLTELSKQTLRSEPAIAAWAKSLGRMTYDYKGAFEAAKGLSDEADATGKSFEEMTTLGALLHNVLGVGGDTSEALGEIRAQAQALGTTGGPAALQDQLVGLSGALSHIQVKTEEERRRLIALAAVLGLSRGGEPEGQGRVQQRLIGAVTSDPLRWERYLGHSIQNAQGEVVNPLGVLKEIRAKTLKRFGVDARRVLQLNFDAESGAALYNADFDAGERATKLKSSKEAAQRQKEFAASPSGQRLKALQGAKRDERTVGDALSEWETKVSGALEGHPLIKLGLTGVGLGTGIAAGKAATKAAGVAGRAAIAAGAVPTLAAGALGYGVGYLADKYGHISDAFAGTGKYNLTALEDQLEFMGAEKARRERRLALTKGNGGDLVVVDPAERIAQAIEAGMAKAPVEAKVTIVNMTGGPIVAVDDAKGKTGSQ